MYIRMTLGLIAFLWSFGLSTSQLLHRLTLAVITQRVPGVTGLTTYTLAFVSIKFIRRRAFLLAKAATCVFVEVLSCGTFVRLAYTLA